MTDMLEENVAGIERMAANWLQSLWRMYLRAKKRQGEEIANPGFVYYCGATGLIEAIGGKWRRIYRGDSTEEQLNDASLYSHWVILPSDERCKRLNFDAWGRD